MNKIRRILRETLQAESLRSVIDDIENGATTKEIAQKYFSGEARYGMTRAAFEIDDTMVLKMLINDQTISHRDLNRSAMEQKQEIDTMKKFSYNPMIPKVFYYDDRSYQWLIMERVIPCRENDFKRIAKMNFGGNAFSLETTYTPDEDETYDEAERYGAYDKWGDEYDEPEHDFVTFLDYVYVLIHGNYKQSKKQMMVDYVNDCMAESEFARNFVDFAQNGGNITDLMFIRNWGIANRNGKTYLVALDLG